MLCFTFFYFFFWNYWTRCCVLLVFDQVAEIVVGCGIKVDTITAVVCLEWIRACGGLAALSADGGDLAVGSAALIVLVVGVTEGTDSWVSSWGVEASNVDSVKGTSSSVLEPVTSAGCILFAAHCYSDNLIITITYGFKSYCSILTLPMCFSSSTEQWNCSSWQLWVVPVDAQRA